MARNHLGLGFVYRQTVYIDYLNLDFDGPSIHFLFGNWNHQSSQPACCFVVKLNFNVVHGAYQWPLRAVDSEAPTSSSPECNFSYRRSAFSRSLGFLIVACEGIVDFKLLNSSTGVEHVEQANGGKGDAVRDILVWYDEEGRQLEQVISIVPS